MGKESSTFKFTRFREKVVPNRKKNLPPEVPIAKIERRHMDKVYVVVYLNEVEHFTVAAFDRETDARTAAIALAEEKRKEWDIPSEPDGFDLVKNWHELTDGAERLEVFKCHRNLLDRSDDA